MRISLLSSLLTVALASTVVAAPPRKLTEQTTALEDDGVVTGAKAASKASGGKSPINDAGEKVTAGSAETSTEFNGIEVPALTELGTGTLDEAIAKGYWYGDVDKVAGTPTDHSQACRILLTILPSLQSVCAHMADALRVLLHIRCRARIRYGRPNKVTELIHEILRLPLRQGRLRSKW